jgi:hypothetical protein
MDGVSMCKLSKEAFLDRTPGCVGDILYEHLQQLQDDAALNAATPPPTDNNDDDDAEVKPAAGSCHSSPEVHARQPEPRREQHYEELLQSQHAMKGAAVKPDLHHSQVRKLFFCCCCHLAVPMTPCWGPRCSQIWPFVLLP